jgi:hypothetical protein
MKEAGYVYILTNPSFKEDWVKIGKSSRPVDIRSKELDNTAVPLPFEIYATLKTVKYNEVEQQLHQMIDRLTDIRIRPNREFFNIAPDKALELLTIISRTLDDAEISRYNDVTHSIISPAIKTISQTPIKTNSNNQSLQLEFWTEFNENAYRNPDFQQKFRLRKPNSKYWKDISIGHSSFHICLTVSIQHKRLTAGLYFDNCKNIYEYFSNISSEVERIIEEKVQWINNPNKQDARFLVSKEFHLENKDEWDNGLMWLYKKCIQLYSISKLKTK